MAASKRVLSIRWIVSGAVALLTAVAVLSVGVIGERGSRHALTREVQSRLLVEARNLALASSRALLSEFPELTLAPILSEMETTGDGREFTCVVDRDERIRGHASPRRIGEEFRVPENALPQPVAAGLQPGEQFLAGPNVLIASAPVKHPQGHRIGSAYVSFPSNYVTEILAAARRQQILIVSILLGLGVMAVPFLMGVLLRPVSVLREGLERIGRGDLETPVQLRDRTEFGLLAETMNRMSAGLREARVQELERQRLSREVELAREIQSSLLPAGSETCGPFVIDGAHRAAAEVGGDLWDAFPLDDRRWGVAIADVSGKGLAGCLVTSMLSALLRAFAPDETSPSALLVRLEKHLALRSGTFITMFYGILDASTGTLTYSSAAHSPLLIARADGTADWRRTEGIPIGAIRGGALQRSLRDETIRLDPGDLLVQYTDGINEAFDPAGEEQFGFDRVEAAVRAGANRGPDGVISTLRRELSTWTADGPPLDDETLLVIRREPTPAKAAAPTGREPQAVLDEARQRGRRLELDARLDRLAAIRHWIIECPGLDALAEGPLLVLESALYEVCANVVEHGYDEDPSRTFEVWWLPGPTPARGQFIVVDSGRPFEPGPTSLDLSKPEHRRRGRGLGLEILRKAMKDIVFHPGTPEGNITVLEFDPQPLTAEVRHV